MATRASRGLGPGRDEQNPKGQYESHSLTGTRNVPLSRLFFVTGMMWRTGSCRICARIAWKMAPMGTNVTSAQKARHCMNT